MSIVYASVVLYKNRESEVKRLIISFLKTRPDVVVILIDNSPEDTFREFEEYANVIYIHNPSNPGFGAAHNIAIKYSTKMGADYHFVVNPDIYFDQDILTPMINYISSDSAIGMVMPEILNEDGTIQHLPKLLPSPFSIVMRKFKFPMFFYKRFINKYELRYVKKNRIYNTPVLSGCFTLFNLKAIKEIGMFDDIFFMYFEDWDLSRRIHKKYKTLYFPEVSVFHGYKSEANKNPILFKVFLTSAVRYFNKWGWFFDDERGKMNDSTVRQFGNE